jgi:predicted permease
MNLIPPSFAKDFRHTLRSLWRDKAFSATVLATCALCLGANIVIFAVVHAILFAPLPFDHPEQLVLPDNSYTKSGLEHIGASVANSFEWKENVPAFSEVGVYDSKDGLIGEPGSPERVETVYATPGFFRVLGVRAELGRLFLEDEGSYASKGHWNVAVLSDAFWRQHYAADPGVIGKTMKVEGGDRYIVGVLPPGFRFLSTKAQIFVTMILSDKDRGPANRHWNSTNIIARMKPGATVAQAQAQIDSLNAKLEATDPGAAWAKGAGFRTTVRGLHAAQVEKVRSPLLLLEGAAILLLGVGCVNMLSLLLVRASTRAKDISVRQVLGASRLNIAARLLTETATLALLGTALGVALAAVGLRFVGRLGVAELPLGASVRMDASVVAASAAAAILLALALAAPLIAFFSGLNLAPALASESRSGTTTRGRHRFRNSLVVAQIALAFVLLTGAGLLGLSFRRMLAVDPGFKPENVVTAWVGVPWGNSYKDKTQRNAFAERWLQTVRALPGVESVGLGTFVPVGGDRGTISMIVEGHEPGAGDAAKSHNDAMVEGDYFEALGIPLREGRLLDESDSAGAKKVCVIDEDFARHYWTGQSPLGYRIAFGGRPIDANSLRIVGVVGSVKHGSLAERDSRGIVYFPMAVYGFPFRMATIVRSTLPSSVVVPAMRKALLGLDPILPLDGISTMDAVIDESLIFPRSLMFTAALFGAMALLLSAVGVYGIMAYSVGQREREIGIRMALGAQPMQILTQFMGHGGKLLFIGLVAGCAASLAAGRLIGSLLFNVSASNASVYAAAIALLSGVVLLATLIPSRRASAISAIEALRRD